MSAAPRQTFCLRPGCYAVVDGNEAWFEIVHITAIAILCTSIVSSGYVIARSVLVDKQLDKTGKRFPVFLSACDFCFGLSYICDHLYVYTKRYYPGPSLCALLGALVQIFIAAQAVVVVMTTATLYLQMIHEEKVALGRCDVYVLLAIIAVNAPMIGAGVPLDVFGPSGYWIYLNAAHPNYVVAQLVYVDLPAIVCFGLTAYFATTVHLHIRKFSVAHRNVAHPPGRAPASMAADEPSHVSDQGRKVVKGANRVNLFAAMYLAQWFPVMLSLAIPGGTRNQYVNLLVVITVNMGGAMNSIAFIYLRGWRRKPGRAPAVRPRPGREAFTVTRSVETQTTSTA